MNWDSILKFGLLGLLVGIGLSLFIPTVFIESKQVDLYSSITTYHTAGQTAMNIAKYGLLGASTFIVFTLAYQLNKQES